MSDIVRGNVLLYTSDGQWYNRLICKVTQGPYCHAAIALSPDTVIEATNKGIARNRLLPTRLMTPIDLAAYTTPERIEQALTWAELQAGKQYGWVDILDQAIKFLAPNNPFRLSEDGHMDCSDLACRYLLHAGVSLPDSYLDTHTVTPNDLARVFSLLPPRTGHALDVAQSTAERSKE